MTPSPAFRVYWYLACERQRILKKRQAGQPPPWTDDPILQVNRFTNAYRVADRVSQYLLTEILYYSDGKPRVSDPTATFKRVMLFKIFNSIETWELIKNSLGERDWSLFDVEQVLTKAKENKETIYNNAYMMPPGESGSKRADHLMILRKMLSDGFPARLAKLPTLENAFNRLQDYPLMGDFLTMQYVTDLNYSAAFNWAEEFIMPGPGALSGIKKCFGDDLKAQGFANPTAVIDYCQTNQTAWFKHYGLEFDDLGLGPLQLIDCQNLFCETDKYCRVAHPEIEGIGGRVKIKQRYMMDPRPLTLFTPPKWNTA